MAEIKTIDGARLNEIAAQRGFSREIMIRDYYVTLILYLLKDVKGIYFKGGTALHKIFLNHSRLSEDADYTCIRDVNEIRGEIEETLLETGIFTKVTKDKDVDSFVRLLAHYTNHQQKDDVVFIDLNKRAKLIEKPEVHIVPHFYPEDIPEFSVRCLAKKEMLAEKMAATIGRNKPRDHYDIYKIIQAGWKIDEKLVEKKCKLSGVEFNKIKMFNRAKKLYRRWNEDMVPMLAVPIEFEEVMTTLAEYFDLKGEKDKLKNR